MHALVPVKRLVGAKTRLAPVLTADERRQLVLAMLADVLDALRAARSVRRVSVVTSDDDVGAAAAAHGAGVLPDGDLPWNDGIWFAQEQLGPKPDDVVVVSADVPLLTPGEVDALVAAAPGRGLAVARARDGGTNAVVLRPANALRLNLGRPDSAVLHRTRAEAADLAVRMVDLPGLALDVDTPADLTLLRDVAQANGADGRAARLVLGRQLTTP